MTRRATRARPWVPACLIASTLGCPAKTPGSEAPRDEQARAAPARSGTPPPIIELEAGDHSTCARFEDRRVVCVGGRERRALGPSSIAELPAVESIAGGDEWCARDARGAVWCWGAERVARRVPKLASARELAANAKNPRILGENALFDCMINSWTHASPSSARA